MLEYLPDKRKSSSNENWWNNLETPLFQMTPFLVQISKTRNPPPPLILGGLWLTWCFYIIEKGEELWLIEILIIHIISKRNDSVNIILLCTLHDRLSVSFIIYYFIYLLASANVLKLLVKWKESVNDHSLDPTPF